MKEKIFYSSHGCSAKWSEIKDIEVFERENYELAEVEKWEECYDLTPSTPVIWVTDSLNMAVSYMADASEFDEIIQMSEEKLLKYIIENDLSDPSTFTVKDGTIIPESDDGEHGYLMILNH